MSKHNDKLHQEFGNLLKKYVDMLPLVNDTQRMVSDFMQDLDQVVKAVPVDPERLKEQQQPTTVTLNASELPSDLREPLGILDVDGDITLRSTKL